MTAINFRGGDYNSTPKCTTDAFLKRPDWASDNLAPLEKYTVEKYYL